MSMCVIPRQNKRGGQDGLVARAVISLLMSRAALGFEARREICLSAETVRGHAG
jgi:hypothetical protein